MTSLPERQRLIRLIGDAVRCGSGRQRACRLAGISLRTLQRWRQCGACGEDRRPSARRPAPANRLTEAERARILQTSARPEYADRPPCYIVPALADRGIYIASESSFRRVMKAPGMDRHRGRVRPHGTYSRPQSYTATAPNRLWSWDITHLPASVTGRRFYLYMITDVFSRRITGAEVHEKESGQYASALLQRAVWSEKCRHSGLVLHADNGAPMKSFTMQAKLYELGITPSHSRPRVSNDNPYSESLFRTLKYCPQWPREGFSDLEGARRWVYRFVQWYNTKHRHSGLRWVTPDDKHHGLDVEVLAKRHELYEEARRHHPERWSGKTRNWTPVMSVSLNPEKTQRTA